EQDILEKTDKLSILNNEISSGRKIIEESQPIVFSILQYLVNAGLNEHDILLAFKIFKTDLCNNMPFGDRTYLERLSKDLDEYKTIRDTLQGLNNKILNKKSYIDKLAVVKSNLEAFLFSLVITTIYFYSTILFNTQQVQIQKNFIKRILLISIFNYYLPFLCIVTSPKKVVRSKCKKELNNNKRGKRNKKLQRQKK
ncbi:MAG TPA: hypothetical protein VJ583_10490, partial [Nitrososphaeraceae archaeon]|nr:hypothetical protein [Nitrososphaeraceae archaeon]